MSNPYRDRNEYVEQIKAEQDAGFSHSMLGTDSSNPAVQEQKEFYDRTILGKSPSGRHSPPMDGNGVGILLLILVAPLPVIGLGGVAGFGLVTMLKGWGWHTIYAWGVGIALFALVTYAMVHVYARLPVAIPVIIGGAMGLFLAGAVAINGLKLGMHWPGAIALVAIALLGAGIGAGWFLGIVRVCEWMVGDEKFDFSWSGSTLHLVLGYVGLIGLWLGLRALRSAEEGFGLYDPNSGGRHPALYALAGLWLLLALGLAVYATSSSTRLTKHRSVGAGLAVLPVALLASFPPAFVFMLLVTIAWLWALGLPRLTTDAAGQFVFFALVAVAALAPIALLGRATVRVARIATPARLGILAALWVFMAGVGWFLVEQSGSAWEDYQSSLPLSDVQLAALRQEEVERERLDAEQTRRQLEVRPQLIKLMNDHFEIRAEGSRVVYRGPIYGALETLARERNVLNSYETLLKSQMIARSWTGRKQAETNDSLISLLASDYRRCLEELSRLIEEFGGYDRLTVELVGRNDSRFAPLIALLKQRMVLNQMIRTMSKEPPLLEQGAQVYATLAPGLARFVPTPQQHYSPSMGEILRIAMASKDSITIRSWEAINHQFAALPEGELARKEYIHNAAESLDGLLDGLKRRGLGARETAIVDGALMELRPDRIKLCQDLVAGGRRDGKCS